MALSPQQKRRSLWAPPLFCFVIGWIRNPCRPCRRRRRRHRHRGLVLGPLGDHGLGGDQERGDRGRVLQGDAHDLGRIDDAGRDHVDILFLLRVEAEIARLLQHLADHDRAFDAGILGDLADRRFERLGHDVDAGLDVGIVRLQRIDGLLGAQQRDAAARHDAFLDRRAGGIERVIDAILALLHLDLGGAADLDHRNAAGELRQPLLQLLAVIVGGGLLDLLP